MENSNISPVVEVSEVRAMFERLTTSFVSLSAQARELEHMKDQVNEMQRRLDDLTVTRGNLQREVAEALEMAHNVERERDAARAEVSAKNGEIERLNESFKARREDFESRLKDTQDNLLSRDVRIAELEQALRDANARTNTVERERDNIGNSRDYWKDRCEQAERDRSSAFNTISEQRGLIAHLDSEKKSVADQLSKIESVFKTVFAKAVEAQEAPLPEEPAVQQAVNW